jgi:hypothetical protein
MPQQQGDKLMRARHLLLGVIGVVLGAAGAFSNDFYLAAPAPLDIGSLKAATRMAKSAVGGGKDVEGFVTTYGSFRLGDGRFEGSVITPARKPGSGVFHQFPLMYINDYTDPGTGTSGSLYYTSLDDDTQRFYLFGKTNIACGDPVEQRALIAYDGKGNVLHQVRASYARSEAHKEHEREKKEKGKAKGKKKKRDDDD